ncbi:MAG TPA: molybdenum cofactor guanylyltransferase [Acidimicrobiia bacterium]|jgi:molybdopterin-guanine dinucleotide biosynthesis protein A
MVGLAGTVAGLLLTGGGSRRMGTDKARLLFDGRRLAERAAEVLEEACHIVIEVGPGVSGLPAVREDPPGEGPLAALGAGAAELARRGHSGPVLVLAVDMPFVDGRLLAFLRDRPGPATAVPMAGGQPQPLCARYGPDARAAVPGLLAAGERSLRALLAAVEVGWVEPAEWEPVGGPDAFCDLDTPDDLARLRHDGGDA